MNRMVVGVVLVSSLVACAPTPRKPSGDMSAEGRLLPPRVSELPPPDGAPTAIDGEWSYGVARFLIHGGRIDIVEGLSGYKGRSGYRGIQPLDDRRYKCRAFVSTPKAADWLRCEIAILDANTIAIEVFPEPELTFSGERIVLQRVNPLPDGVVISAKSPSTTNRAAATPTTTTTTTSTTARAHAISGKRVAVLEVTADDLPPTTLALFSDSVRAAALDATRGTGAIVMTREALAAILADMGDCASIEGACELETGRNIGADFLVTGEIAVLGGSRFMTLKLFDVHTGNLLATRRAKGKDAEELLGAVDAESRALFSSWMTTATAG